MAISDRKYRKWRSCMLAKEPLCRLCRAKGIIRAADELDHIVRRSDAPERVMDESNVQSLCRECHERKTAEENKSRFRDWGCDENGSLTNPFD